MAAEDVREFYHRQGRAEEQERIIALLEETAYCGSHDDLIALIKGENK